MSKRIKCVWMRAGYEFSPPGIMRMIADAFDMAHAGQHEKGGLKELWEAALTLARLNVEQLERATLGQERYDAQPVFAAFARLGRAMGYEVIEEYEGEIAPVIPLFEKAKN